jgi:hypothetical protein
MRKEPCSGIPLIKLPFVPSLLQRSYCSEAALRAAGRGPPQPDEGMNDCHRILRLWHYVVIGQSSEPPLSRFAKATSS